MRYCRSLRLVALRLVAVGVVVAAAGIAAASDLVGDDGAFRPSVPSAARLFSRACGNGVIDFDPLDEGTERCDQGKMVCGPLALNRDTPCSRDSDCLGDLCDECGLSLPRTSCKGVGNRDDVPNACRSDCTLPSCGDGVHDDLAGEECDDGNQSNQDGCLNDCKLATCGDGSLCNENNSQSPCTSGNPDGGKEACDDGNTKRGDGCSPFCTLEICGDGKIEKGVEECDEGAARCASGLSEGLPCDTDRQCFGFEAGDSDGDGVEDQGCTLCAPDIDRGVNPAGTPPYELCGPVPNRDDLPNACRSDCTLPHCGDGIVDSQNIVVDTDSDGRPDEGEACDDGNVSNNDGCTSSCSFNECGDGFLCTENNPISPCSSRPTFETGGVCVHSNGQPVRVDIGFVSCVTDADCPADAECRGKELCDDGNLKSGDGCSGSCLLESCGDGTIEEPEGCDNGMGLCASGLAEGQSCGTDAECIGASAGLGCVVCLPDIRVGDDPTGLQHLDPNAAPGSLCGGQVNRDDLPNACRSNCALPRCGDGIVDSAHLVVDTDGDGVPDLGEECDDANSSNRDGCTNECRRNVCGDGHVCTENNPMSPCETGVTSLAGGASTRKEQCDDGNTKDGDGCSFLCVPESCGDGIVQGALLGGSEECDTGLGGCGSGINEFSPCSRDEQCVGAAAGEACVLCMADILAGRDDTGLLYQDAGFDSLCHVSGPNRDDVADLCRSSCVLPSCGDGITDTDEQCDDGNASNNDACLKNCRWNTCGDGNVCRFQDLKDPTNGNNCRADFDGDGIGEEQCDDGNDDAEEFGQPRLDGCVGCRLTHCGDAQVQFPEQCDGGVRLCQEGAAVDTVCTWNGDCLGFPCGCDPTSRGTVPPCSVSAGGDGVGNGDDPSVPNSCRSDCAVPSCGDGVLDASLGEACDDGNDDNQDTCVITAPGELAAPDNCVEATCGDGFVCADSACRTGPGGGREECDDGNQISADGCSQTCAVELCGNGVVDTAVDPLTNEECDPGAPGSACAASCCALGGLAAAKGAPLRAPRRAVFADATEAFDSLTGCHTPKLVASAACHGRLRRSALKIDKLISQSQTAYMSGDSRRSTRLMRRAGRLLGRIERVLATRRVEDACPSDRARLMTQIHQIKAIHADMQDSMAQP